MEPTTFGGRIIERSFRNSAAAVIFALAVILPTLDAWKSGSETTRRDIPSAFPTLGSPSFGGGPRSTTGMGFGGTRYQSSRPGESQSFTAGLMWLFTRPLLAGAGATLSMLLWAPFRGCKRYAMLFGPITGLIAMSAVALWLAGRSEIYRAEPIVVGIVAALPTAAIWFACCSWAYPRYRAATLRPEPIEAQIIG